MAKRTTKKAARKTAKRGAKSPGGADARGTPLRTPAPVPLSALIGQERAVGVLQRAIDAGRVHHAWIFHGPSGVGKFTAALAFAGVLLDPEAAPTLSGTVEPPADSAVQRLLRAGAHPDLHVVVKELARYSDSKQVRDAKLQTIPKAVVDTHLLRPAVLASNLPGGLAGKVFIVDEAELLDRSPTNAPVQNALLKTLEEPPEGTVIVLVTASEDRLLPTIRSRCQRVAFTPLSDADMQRWLDVAKPDVPPGAAPWLLSIAGGSPGALVGALDAGLHGWHLEIDPMLDDAERGRFHVALGATMTRLIDDRAAAWVKEGEKRGENRSKDAANRVAARQMLGLVAEHYRAGLADPVRAGAAVRAIDHVVDASRELSSAVQVQFVMDHLAARLPRDPDRA